ncbi:MAG: NAD(P)-binding protein, partial [Candidatus Methanospirareceae archaeon]
EIEVIPEALVIGGGIAGIQAALDIADAGYKVYLVEKEPSIGGHMAQLDKTFPTLDCAACILTPKMVDVARHPNIELITYAEVEDVEGYVGNFKVRIRKKPRYVDEARCTGCGECANVCPVEVLNEFDLGLGRRKAIYVPFPQAVPLVYTIDKREGKPPCRLGCPAGVNVQAYVALISQRKYKEAVEVIRETNPLPAVCGYVCPHPCENECNRRNIDEPIAIAALKRFVADFVYKEGEKPERVEVTRKERIAIIGSGPAGLTAAYYLRRMGYYVKIFEKLPVAGGMLSVGIPSYRLPKDVLEREIEYIKGIGVEIETNSEVDKDKFEALRKEYDAIFISVGAHESLKLGIEGEDLEGVIHGVHFLRDLNLGKEVKLGKKVAVIGGGDVAIDVARSALRLGSDVVILYRRSREEMPARAEEVEAAEEEGVKIEFLVAPKRIIGEDGKVKGIECIRMKLGEPDETGRRRPIPIEGSEFTIDVDTVIPAIGQSSALAFLEGSGVETPKGRWIKVDDNLMTSQPGIFAGGDAVTGPALVIDAIAAGRKAAIAIDRYLRGEEPPEEKEEKKIRIEDIPPEALPKEKKSRRKMPKIEIERRRRGFDLVELGFSEEEAIEEAKRCLNCGVCSECKLCVQACGERNAINHEMKEEMVELKVGAIIVATGYDLFDPATKPEYGYGKYDNVITGLEFERLCSASGPTGGKIEINGKEPKRVVFIQCVGSRDRKGDGNEYCSRVCCMYTAKHAHLVKERIPDAKVTVFYTDIRAFGKGYEEFYQRVKEEGITYLRRELDDPIEVVKEGDVLYVKAHPHPPVEADMVVLATATMPRANIGEVGKLLKISRSADGFFLEAHPKLRPVDTPTDGIFLAGACQAPKDIPDTVAQASAAASRVCSLLARGKVKAEVITARVNEALCRGCGFCVDACPYDALELKMINRFGYEVKVASVNEALCKGCGLCSATCLSGAIQQKMFLDEQILNSIAALGGLY